MDKGLLASHGSGERPGLGRFTRLRTPLGLVMRRLSADCDRETAAAAVSPNATLFSVAMSDPTGVCSSLTTMASLSLSPCPSIHPFTYSVYLFVSLSLSHSLSRGRFSVRPLLPTTPLDALASPSHRFTTVASLPNTRSPWVIWEPRGWLSNEIYKGHRKWDR